MALDKKPAGPRNSFIIRPPRLSPPFLFSPPASSLAAATAVPPLSQISVSVMPLVNYRLALPFRRALATFIWPARSGIYRTCEFRRAADLSNYTDRRPLSVLMISAMSRISDAPATGRGEHRFNAFVQRSKKLSGTDNHPRWSPSHRRDYNPDTTLRSHRDVLQTHPSIQLEDTAPSVISDPSRTHGNHLITVRSPPLAFPVFWHPVPFVEQIFVAESIFRGLSEASMAIIASSSVRRACAARAPQK